MSIAGRGMSGHASGREARGKALHLDKIDALIWGMRHPNAAVRRCCLELLDAHPCDRAVPTVVAALSDPVPRVRWHAVHALECDACKAGRSLLSASAIEALQPVAASDPSTCCA